MLREVVQDTTALGGTPLQVISIVVAWSVGQNHLALQIATALAIAYTITFTVRALYWRQRPDKQKYRNWLSKLDASSFPSLHTARAAAFLWILTAFFQSAALGILGGIVIVIVAVTRVWLKRHWVSDVIVGGILGCLIGAAVSAYV